MCESGNWGVSKQLSQIDIYIYIYGSVKHVSCPPQKHAPVNTSETDFLRLTGRHALAACSAAARTASAMTHVTPCDTMSDPMP